MFYQAVYYHVCLTRPFIKDTAPSRQNHSHHKIKLAEALVRITFVGVGFGDLSANVVHHQVHLGQSHGLAHVFLSVNINVVKVVIGFAHKRGTLHKHTTRTTRRIKDLSGIRLNHLHNKTHH